MVWLWSNIFFIYLLEYPYNSVLNLADVTFSNVILFRVEKFFSYLQIFINPN